MLWPFSICFCLFVLTYILTLLLNRFLNDKGSIFSKYSLKKDSYLYILLMFAIGLISVVYFVPDMHDAVIPIKTHQIVLCILFSALIYLFFLLETTWLLNLGIFFFSILSCFLFLNPASLILTNLIPWQAEILIFGVVFALITLSSKVLIGLPGIFSTYMSTVCVSLIFIAFAGGIPFYIAFIAALMVGVWLAALQVNFYDFNFKINEGIVLSSTFLLCSLFLIGINELAAPSMLILAVYPIAESLISLMREYILKQRQTNLYQNSVYFKTFQKGVPIEALHTLLLKLGIINGGFALFQLYAPNVFTLPLIAFVINLWLLGKLSQSDKGDVSLKETNAQMIQNIKQEIQEIKQGLKKD